MAYGRFGGSTSDRHNLVADDVSREEILEAYPYLEPEDVQQALRYAAWPAEENVEEVA